MQHTNRSVFPLPLYSDTSSLLWYFLTRSIIFWYVSFCRVFVGAFPVSMNCPESIPLRWLPLTVLFTSSDFPFEIFYLPKIKNIEHIMNMSNWWLIIIFIIFTKSGDSSERISTALIVQINWVLKKLKYAK